MPGKMRSPNYPALSLPVATGYAKRLWNIEKRTAVSHEAAATAMGFKSLSGPARVAIGALRQYGLVDKADKGHVRLSDRAIHILLGEGGERNEAVRQAELEPELFQDLVKTHADASENAIRSFLLTKRGFSDDGARKAAKAFRETLNLAKPGQAGYTPADEQEKPEDMQGTDTGLNAGGGGTGKLPDGVFSLTVPFAKGSVSVQVRVTGAQLTAAHLVRVCEYLKLAQADLQESERGHLHEIGQAIVATSMK